MNLFRSPFFLPWLYPQLLWRIETSSKELYLTFDDGPVPGLTEFALEELKRVNARASFFCIGDNIRKNPQVFRKIVEQGHAVGNHTFHHLSGWKTKKEKYLANIKECDEEISKITSGQSPNLFRPPYGRIKRSQIGLLKEYKIVMWDVLTYDYEKRLSAEQCLKGTVSATRPGSIIVFHDSIKAEKNMTYALPRFLDHFVQRGFTFKPLS